MKKRLFIMLASAMMLTQEVLIANSIDMPAPYPDGAIPTLNSMGAMPLDLDDPINAQFITYAQSLSQKGRVFEVGAAYGELTLEVLKKSEVLITANDLDLRHLEVLRQRVQQCCSQDMNRLTLVSGDFSNEETIVEYTYDALIMHNVLLFMTPGIVEKSLDRAYKLLNKNGKLFIWALSPYSFPLLVSSYEERTGKGELFPGFIDDIASYSEFHGARLLFASEDLKKLIKRKGFVVEEVFGAIFDKQLNKWIKTDKGPFTALIARKE